MTEHGVYRLLMDHYYALQKPLPGDFTYLCRVARCRWKHEKDALKRVLDSFFESTHGQYCHGRIDKEILKYQRMCDAARKANVMRWRSEPVSYSEVRSQISEKEESKSKSLAAQQAAQPKINGAHKDESPILAKLPLRGGGEFEIRGSFAAELAELYPGVDVPDTLREMRGWCAGNPDRIKTRRGIKRFITRWLQNEQEKYDDQA